MSRKFILMCIIYINYVSVTVGEKKIIGVCVKFFYFNMYVPKSY